MDFIIQGDTLALLFFVALTAGFVDAMAGGGGLITIPVLLLIQLPPIMALGTNKLQGCSGSLTAAIAMLRKKQVRLADVWKPFVAAFLGAGLGTLAVQQINPKALDAVIPLILFGIGFYFLLAPNAGDIVSKPRLGNRLYRYVLVPIIGFYDGFFGPGTGSFFSLIGVSLRGQTLISATAVAKVLNFATNIASLILFVISGKVIWLIGLVMVCGQVIGAYAGAHAAIKGGARVIRPVIVVVCFAMVGRYFWQKGFLPF
ncbi:MAG TPA: TSUP family transporter [Telmatospirillum sp.]|nr:TSUP family transporter [Telmatospirillum sp.]